MDRSRSGDLTVKDFLEHFGVKGMRWGTRRRTSAPGPDASDDVKKAHEAKQKIGPKGNTDRLGNTELQALVTRMNLEKQYSTLVPAQASKIAKGQKFIKGALATGATINQVIQFANSPAGKAFRSQIKKG